MTLDKVKGQREHRLQSPEPWTKAGLIGAAQDHNFSLWLLTCQIDEEK